MSAWPSPWPSDPWTAPKRAQCPNCGTCTACGRRGLDAFVGVAYAAACGAHPKDSVEADR